MATWLSEWRWRAYGQWPPGSQSGGGEPSVNGHLALRVEVDSLVSMAAWLSEWRWRAYGQWLPGSQSGGGEPMVNGVEPENLEVIVNHKSPGYDCVLCNLIGPSCYR